jgi:hypothetical protein
VPRSAIRCLCWKGNSAGANIEFISIHMLFGFIVALALLILAVMAVFTSGFASSVDPNGEQTEITVKGRH